MIPSRKEISCHEAAILIDEKLPGGIFLSTAAEGFASNTMTIGWGGLIRFFNLPVFLVPVRKTRHSHTLLEKSNVFSVSIPLHDMKAELAFAGTKSGRDMLKFEGHGLTAAPGEKVSAPIVAECEIHLECRVIATPDFPEAALDKSLLAKWYADRDMHTLFFGEVISCYTTR